jgi:hypothetical protein
MAKHSSHILEMARKGADHRYQELKMEIGLLVKQFPHLRVSDRASAGTATRTASTGDFDQESGPVRIVKRRKMSAKARKAISVAQKARWAKHKAKKA